MAAKALIFYCCFILFFFPKAHCEWFTNIFKAKSRFYFRMTEGKCTFGTRAPIDINMLNAIIYREVKHFRNYKIYRPNFGSIPVTGKFYAAHDELKAESKAETKKVDDYHENVAQTRAKGPRSKYTAPATENQVYGWYGKPLVPMDRNDNRFYYPQRESKHTKIEIIILMSNPKNKKEY